MTSIPEQFAAYARRATADIDSGRARRDARDELIEHLMDAYEAELDAGSTIEEAITEALERMGPATSITGELADAHTPRFNRRTLAIIIAAGIAVVVGIWAVFYLYFLASFGAVR